MHKLIERKPVTKDAEKMYKVNAMIFSTLTHDRDDFISYEELMDCYWGSNELH